VTQHDPALYLSHIVESAGLVESYVRDLNVEAFREDQQRQDAVVRRLEIMGEAVKHLPDSIREVNPHVPWRRIAGMRDKVIHDYIGLDIDLVWTVATTMMSKLKDDVQAILDTLQSRGAV
jgi:uncharacterized protein with HEPN domain